MLREHSEALLLRELEAEVRKHLSRHMPPSEVSVTFGGGGSRALFMLMALWKLFPWEREFVRHFQ